MRPLGPRFHVPSWPWTLTGATDRLNLATATPPGAESSIMAAERMNPEVSGQMR